MNVREWINEVADESDVPIVVLDGLDEALVGLGTSFGRYDPCAVYSVSKILDILMTRDGMSYEGAQEFFDFNIAGLGVDNPPIFLQQPE